MKNTTKTTPATPTTTPASPGLSLADLTPEQLASLTKQIKEQRKAKGSNRKEWVTIVDKMLHETTEDKSEFAHTTADILAALQEAKLEPVTMSSEDRAETLKRIQTRKQLLAKKLVAEGKVVDVGYKASSTGFALTPDRVISYMKSLDASQRSVIYTALGVKV
jgi:hypothetical protein